MASRSLTIRFPNERIVTRHMCLISGPQNALFWRRSIFGREKRLIGVQMASSPDHLRYSELPRRSSPGKMTTLLFSRCSCVGTMTGSSVPKRG